MHLNIAWKAAEKKVKMRLEVLLQIPSVTLPILELDKDPIQHLAVFLKIHFSEQTVQGSTTSYQVKDEMTPNFPKIEFRMSDAQNRD